MLQELNGDDLYAELIMLRTNDRRYFIVVEGVADVAVLDRFVNLDDCLPIPAYGKDNAQACLTRVIEDDFPGVFAILDRDWLGLLPGDLEDDRIVHTDDYDLDACIFFADGVYIGIASSFCAGSGFRIDAAGCTWESLREACIEMAFPVGLLRYVSEQNGLGLNLTNFPLGEVLDTDLSVNLDSLVDLAISRTKKGSFSKQHILTVLSNEQSMIVDRPRYCSGHDLAKAFSILIKKRWKAKVGADLIERSARSSLTPMGLQRMTLYANASKWTDGTKKRIWRI
ncbi:hypothetical protein U5640_21515 [Streptomyces sp. SS7]|uniref:hypothetical protein n=1 Tax=Streptomyces sp. SS7 TaxID=3108485 RepID=UPI0030ED878F